jgi:hypothetical protein
MLGFMGFPAGLCINDQHNRDPVPVHGTAER